MSWTTALTVDKKIPELKGHLFPCDPCIPSDCPETSKIPRSGLLLSGHCWAPPASRDKGPSPADTAGTGDQAAKDAPGLGLSSELFGLAFSATCWLAFQVEANSTPKRPLHPLAQEYV